jgi:hypothetical protein
VSYRIVIPAAAALALACAAAVLSTAGASAAKANGHGITFETPAVVDPIHAYGEPDVGVDSLGRVFSSGPTGTGTQRSTWEASVDGGHTFRVVTPNAPPSAIQGIEDPPGGGDTDIAFARSGTQYFADLYALACLRVAETSDGGANVNQGFLGCGTSPGADRQWLAVYDPAPGTPHQSAYAGATPLVYLEFNNLVSGASWNMSTDGVNYSNAVAGSSPGSEASYSPFGADGYPSIDQQTGKVFQAAGSQNADGTFDLLLNIGTPDASGQLTFLDAPGSGPGLIHIADNLKGSPDTLFTVSSLDAGRNLIVCWAISPNDGNPAERQVFVSAASAASGWKKWTKPVQVSDGSTATGDAVNVFPWVQAGGPGRADAVWYGSDKNVDPSSQNNQSWNVFMAQAVFPVDGHGAVTGAAPSLSLVKVSPHPMHYNDICLAGTDCIESQGNRNLADFFQVKIDRTGAAEVVYDDTSNGLVQPGFTPDNNQTVDHAGAPLVTLARQSGGMGLFGKPVSGSSNATTTGITDPPGDARYPVINGQNVPGMDIVGSSLALSPDGKTLNVTTKVVNASNPLLTASAITGATLLQYVTRWQMGNTIYYAAMTNNAADQPSFYAGQAQSVDLCSVSACFPHVLTYPEANLGGTAESGNVTCPAAPSVSNPCSITVTVAAADVGSPTAKSVLEEVGSYAFAASHPQGTTTNAQALADDVPLQIDGACCYNFAAPKR